MLTVFFFKISKSKLNCPDSKKLTTLLTKRLKIEDKIQSQDGDKVKEKKDGDHEIEEIEGRFAKAPRELKTIETPGGYA